MSEKLSVKTSTLREEMRLVSAITAFNLIQEKRFDEAEPYRASFIEVKESSVQSLAKDLGSQFLPNGNESEQVASRIIEVANVLSKDPASINSDEAESCTSVLMELLDAVSVKS